MYEYETNNNNAQTNSSVTDQIATNEQLKRLRKAEKKVARGRAVRKFFMALTLGLTFGIVAGFGFVGVTRIVNKFFPDKAIVSEVTKDLGKEKGKSGTKEPKKELESTSVVRTMAEDPKMEVAIPSAGMDVSQIVENSMPSIVSVTKKSVQEVRSMFGMGIQQYESESAGSGIIIGQNDKEILIVTNNHVVEKANALTVSFVDDEVYEAQTKGTDPDRDLAVIGVSLENIKPETLDVIKVAVCGDSSKLRVGEQVVAIGNALGYGQSVTTGIISALGRDHTDDNVDNPLLQTDAAINPGNSGGALLNMRGELVGINCAKTVSTSIEGVGYAIPMEQATPIIESLMSRQTREEVPEEDRGYIGITGISVDSETSRAYGVPQGVYIQSIEEDSPAQKSGLVKTDVIRKFDGVSVSSISDIRNNLNYYRAGETVEVQIYRIVDGEYIEKTIELKLGSREGTSLDPANKSTEEQPSEESDGSKIYENKESEGDRSGLKDPDEDRQRQQQIPEYSFDFGFNPFSLFGY